MGARSAGARLDCCHAHRGVHRGGTASPARGDQRARRTRAPRLGGTQMAITPYLFYEDVSAAVEFLSKAFGFRRFGPTGKTPQGRINHASMRLGREPDAVVMMAW